MKQLEGIYQKRAEDVLACIHNIGPVSEAEQIHRLRVSIKKLRAVIRFLEATAPGAFVFPDRDLFTKIFKRSGELREIQLNKQLALIFRYSATSAKAYLYYLKEREQVAWEAFQRSLNRFPESDLLKLEKKTEKVLMHLSSAKLYTLGKQYAHSEVEVVLTLLKKKLSVRRTHRIRRVLKRTEPILLICKQAKPGKNTRLLIKRIRSLNTLLGNWHDKTVFISSLHRFIKHRKPANPRPLLKWAEFVSNRADADFKEIKARLREFAAQI
jgi:CHAD domain-containing protein